MSKTYHTSHYQHIHRAENEHFWFIGRNEMLASLITQHVKDREGQSFLDIGCGTGVTLELLERLSFVPTGLDVNAKALSYAKKRTTARLVRSSIFQYRPQDLFFAAGAFDVLEHIADEKGFIKKCHSLLVSHGYLLLTVPAEKYLWSDVDVLSGHKRRYTKGMLEALLESSGFRIVTLRYWNSLLLPFYMVWRAFLGNNNNTQMQRYLATPKPWINSVFLTILRIERFLGLSLPFGATLVVVAQKV